MEKFILNVLIMVVIDVLLAQIVVWGLSYEHVNSGLAGPYLILGAFGTLIAVNSARK